MFVFPLTTSDFSSIINIGRIIFKGGERPTSNTGFIKLHRKLTDWAWYDDDVVKSVFFHILLTANYQAAAWRNITLHPGQLVTTVRKLSEELRHTERQTRTALDRLKSTNTITIKTTNKFSVITVENWAKYQSFYDSNDKQNDKQNVTQKTNKRQANCQTKRQQSKKINKQEYKELFYKGEDYTAKSSEKNCCGKFHNVFLSPAEYAEVYAWDSGFTLEKFSEKLHSRGYTYSDHYHALKRWHAEDKHKPEACAPEQPRPAVSYNMAEIERRAEELPVYIPRSQAT